MLFNSYAFIFFFFPFVLAGFFLLGRRNVRAAGGFLVLASLFFYGWWSVWAIPLLVASIGFNFWAGSRLVPDPSRGDARRKRLLVVALAVDLGVLAVFKYADFLIGNANAVFESAGLHALPLLRIALPIGISFYTFTQIAFLVDCWQGKVREPDFMHYALFVTYFPHLVAGPVLHHAQMMPQFAERSTYRADADRISQGLSIFVFGLAKKLLVGDAMGAYADLVFDGVHHGTMPGLASAWLGVLAYTMQIYFDFSGYSDMAVGMSWCLNVRLPLNFASPYQSTDIIEFWRRWHISLSTFLRDYLYIPLGGNRKGPRRRYLNLLATMLLGGLWHGASWTYVAWGGLHGAYLVINHLWSDRFGAAAGAARLRRVAGWALTFLCVMMAWVVFRAESFGDAVNVYKSLFGLHAHGKPFHEYVDLPFHLREFYLKLGAGLFVCLALPPAISLLGWVPQVQALAGRPRALRFATAAMAVLTVVLLGFSVSRLGSYSPFIYYQF
ncbi:MAG TPA: MBOAT family protein [Xanthomonadaceae bacterium]|jgi:alginate O-acetyltransferase complex protein AlgI